MERITLDSLTIYFIKKIYENYLINCERIEQKKNLIELKEWEIAKGYVNEVLKQKETRYNVNNIWGLINYRIETLQKKGFFFKENGSIVLDLDKIRINKFKCSDGVKEGIWIRTQP